MARTIAAALALSACVGIGPAQAAPFVKTVSANGTVQSLCNIGTSTSYSVSIVVTNATGANRNFTVSLDGTAGNTVSGNGSTTTVTKTYATFCNAPTNQTLNITIPRAASGANTINYTIVVRNAGGTQIGTATSPTGSTLTVPARTSANYTIVASANVVNGTTAGTYTSTVTIQTGP